MERKGFVLVRHDSENKIEFLKKERFDETGYSFLRYKDTAFKDYNAYGIVEEWVETDRLEFYKNFEKSK